MVVACTYIFAVAAGYLHGPDGPDALRGITAFAFVVSFLGYAFLGQSSGASRRFRWIGAAVVVATFVVFVLTSFALGGNPFSF